LNWQAKKSCHFCRSMVEKLGSLNFQLNVNVRLVDLCFASLTWSLLLLEGVCWTVIDRYCGGRGRGTVHFHCPYATLRAQSMTSCPGSAPGSAQRAAGGSSRHGGWSQNGLKLGFWENSISTKQSQQQEVIFFFYDVPRTTLNGGTFLGRFSYLPCLGRVLPSQKLEPLQNPQDETTHYRYFVYCRVCF
jgi:hypothetical protein